MTETIATASPASTDPDPVELPEAFQFVMLMDELKNVVRQNPLARGSRKERVAEHSWHLALATILLTEHAGAEIDLERAVTLAVAHDVVECFVGDTFAFGNDVDDQFGREHSAMKVLRDSTTNAAIHRLVDYWEEYEGQTTPEARFVKGLDAVLPIALNFTNPDHSSWRSHGVPADKVRARLDRHGDPGSLREMARRMIDSAQEQGLLK